MTTLKKLCIPMAVCLMTIAVSCNDTKDSKEIAEDINKENFDGKAEKEADKLLEAYASNLFEIAVAQNASVNAVTDEAKKLSAMLVDAHSKMNNDVKALADKKMVALPSDITEDQRKDIEKMAEKKGLDYDKAFVEKMKDKHEKAVDFYEKTADKCDDTEIKIWATQTLPEVRSHLDMVIMTQDAIKDRK
jgi:putative membrane protein